MTGTADGIFGNGTAEAVKKFQAANGLTADGICGEQTYKILKDGKKSDSKISSTTRDLKPGDSGEPVKELQNLLKGLGYFSGTADGIFGNETLTAVKNFPSVVLSVLND